LNLHDSYALYAERSNITLRYVRLFLWAICPSVVCLWRVSAWLCKAELVFVDCFCLLTAAVNIIIAPYSKCMIYFCNVNCYNRIKRSLKIAYAMFVKTAYGYIWQMVQEIAVDVPFIVPLLITLVDHQRRFNSYSILEILFMQPTFSVFATILDLSYPTCRPSFIYTVKTDS